VKETLPGLALGSADEIAVVALAVLGEEVAFSELVKRRQSWLRNLLRRLCREPALADDLAQQAFLQAWRSIGTLKSAGAFGPWLRRLAVNTWLAQTRAQHATAEASLPPGHELVQLPAIGEQLDLDWALAQLSEDQRLCIVLAYNEGMSHDEIAGATGLPLGTVKSHVRRGAERLRALLRAYRPLEATSHVR
jgi:RNA polymerase sigma-70 factor (ECF subfamily)